MSNSTPSSTGSPPATPSNNQTFLFQCMNPDCNENGGIGYNFEGKFPICPKCNSRPPFVGTAVIMHFLYGDKTGNVVGYMNKKFRVACGASHTPTPYNATTTCMDVVNCPRCRQSEVFKLSWRPNQDDPLSYFRNPNLTEEDILQLLKGQDNGSPT